MTTPPLTGDPNHAHIRLDSDHQRVSRNRLEAAVRRLLAYEDAFNSWMHNHHARIELKPTASSGTVIHWHGEYETSRLLRWVMPRYLQKFMQGMTEGLARYAEQCKPTQ
ncbi:SRPBCC family protein [Streptomyces purpurascens]|uniref:SRPBCC family protein n=1 Tax=Streptomyces purpurascens TaxID=1924 RepID=UPI003C2C5FB9